MSLGAGAGAAEGIQAEREAEIALARLNEQKRQFDAEQKFAREKMAAQQKADADALAFRREEAMRSQRNADREAAQAQSNWERSFSAKNAESERAQANWERRFGAERDDAAWTRQRQEKSDAWADLLNRQKYDEIAANRARQNALDEEIFGKMREERAAVERRKSEVNDITRRMVKFAINTPEEFRDNPSQMAYYQALSREMAEASGGDNPNITRVAFDPSGGIMFFGNPKQGEDGRVTDSLVNFIPRHQVDTIADEYGLAFDPTAGSFVQKGTTAYTGRMPSKPASSRVSETEGGIDGFANLDKAISSLGKLYPDGGKEYQSRLDALRRQFDAAYGIGGGQVSDPAGQGAVGGESKEEIRKTIAKSYVAGLNTRNAKSNGEERKAAKEQLKDIRKAGKPKEEAGQNAVAGKPDEETAGGMTRENLEKKNDYLEKLNQYDEHIRYAKNAKYPNAKRYWAKIIEKEKPEYDKLKKEYEDWLKSM